MRRGRDQALCRIYQKYQQDLMTLAVHILGDAAGAEDVVQDVFVTLAQAAGRLELRKSLKGFLVTCVVNRSRDTLRRRQVRHTVDVDDCDPVACPADGPVQEVEHSEQALRLHQAMAQLPDEQREVITLHLHGDMTFPVKIHDQFNYNPLLPADTFAPNIPKGFTWCDPDEIRQRLSQ